MIILEGNECCFKTTVANKLRKELDLPVVKGSSFEQSKTNNADLFDKFIRLTYKTNVIIDRFIFSNLVYADLYDDFAILTPHQIRFIENILNGKEYMLYYLHAPTDVIKDRLSVRGDDYVENEMVEKISKKYEEVIGNSSLNIISFDTTQYTSDEIVEEILSDWQ